MNINEKRELLVTKALSRKQKNQYSQDYNKRIKIESGYGDCSGTVWYWYNKLFGIDIGANTEAQINSKIGEKVNLKITNGIPDETKMKKGDLLYFRGSDNSRTDGVGHVEMYIGNGQIFGHGSGIGGTVKNMNSYCKSRQSQTSTNKLKNKGLICVKRFLKDEIINTVDEDKKLGITTENLNLRDRYDTTGSLLYTIHRGDALLVLKKYNNGWYKVQHKGKTGYVSGKYIKTYSYHWASEALIILINNNIIENLEIWSDYEGATTKAEFASLIYKIIKSKNPIINNNGKHWSYNIMQDLYKSGYINDLDYWCDYPDQKITNTPVMGLICNIKGGVLEKYKKRNVDHVGRNYLNSLCDYGVIKSWEAWIDFDSVCSRGKIMQLVINAFGIK